MAPSMDSAPSVLGITRHVLVLLRVAHHLYRLRAGTLQRSFPPGLGVRGNRDLDRYSDIHADLLVSLHPQEAT